MRGGGGGGAMRGWVGGGEGVMMRVKPVGSIRTCCMKPGAESECVGIKPGPDSRGLT